ncbi:MAG TPA: ribosome-binding factor A [Candidatus Paceibacterota bacterium]|jgi:ribosome-binding factor A|nr:ribosome-binding factor A [Candidatus Paceibacterota bacterium]
MKFFRSERVQKVIREELAKIILREFEFPDALVTITEVEVDKKLERARVLVSVLPAAGSEEALAALEKRAGHLQHLLNVKMNIRPMPRIAFSLDRGPENAALVEKHLNGDTAKD